MRQTKIGNAIVPYYQSTKYSTWKMATSDTGFKPYNASEDITLRNYTKGQNIFTNNQGRVCALKAFITGPSFVNPTFAMSAENTAPTTFDKLSLLINQARLVISQDSQVVHEDVLSSLIEPMPTMVMPFKVGTPTNTFNLPAIVSSNDSSPMVKRSQKVGIYWTPPLMVAQGRTINFDVSLPTGISVDSSLNTWQIVFILVTEEIPQSNLSQVR
jgi:hypothetical protein